MSRRLTVIGGGLAGCEAAWVAAHAGVDVDLIEMRPLRRTEAHETDRSPSSSAPTPSATTRATPRSGS